eukprot:GHVP01065872.1.p1 GENE.GHVP01065872.1~~GHVP01065872.1.p1  ORF type:complete len:272 (-),score=37.06 GHVP01065872.1:84-899(-)
MAIFDPAEIVGLTNKNEDGGFYYDDIPGYQIQLQTEFPSHYNFYAQQEKEESLYTINPINGCENSFSAHGNVDHLMVHPMGEMSEELYNPYMEFEIQDSQQFPVMSNSISGSYIDYCQNMDSNISPLLHTQFQQENYQMPDWHEDVVIKESTSSYSNSRIDCSMNSKRKGTHVLNKAKNLYQYSPNLHNSHQDKSEKDYLSSVSPGDSADILGRRRKSTSCLRHPVAAICRTTERMQIFDSILEASLALDVPRSNIQSCLKRHGKTAKVNI